MIPPSFGTQTASNKRVTSISQLSGASAPKRVRTQANDAQCLTRSGTTNLPLTPPSTSNAPHQETATGSIGNLGAANQRFDNAGEQTDNGGFEFKSLEPHCNGDAANAVVDGPKSDKNNQKRLDPRIVDLMKDLEINQLRQKVTKHAQYKRLTADERHVLTKLYTNYQRQVLLLAAERLLKINPVLKHLGNRSRFRGPTMYNNFCEYNVEAWKSFYNGGEIISGGSFMGEQFIDMFSQDKKTDIEASFLSFAGSKESNYTAAREKLNTAISKVTHGVQAQWPGKSTTLTLKKLGVTLRIKDNDHGITVNDFCGKPGAMRNERLQYILRAFHEDLVVLDGPPPPDAPVTLGADPDN
ncbi:hypothetical protein PTTG_07744 [Puccinia triticina 1-1 BBBD Race 1]|uniref:Uncharacterized protein n=1 Tax=Puccinia triticina (isolate 1-1 / race 1 (BBBD)) TaxID=630390 RepID=A0A0C4F3R3_PUCT1|nr:hypothetical protein PTTG_07744 [Puccinia triticina 1-1 BBBD Race 1]